MVLSISFGENEILDMVVMRKDEVVKTLLRRLKYYKDQEADAESSESEDESIKSETAVEEAVRRSKSIHEK